MKKVLVTAISCLTATSSLFAQDNSLVTGIALNGAAGGRCENMTGFEPARYPGSNDKIKCYARLTSELTFRGAGSEIFPGGFTKISGPDLFSFQDVVGNSYNQLKSLSQLEYCGANSCYAEFGVDRANRAYWSSITVPNRLNAVNGNKVIGTMSAVNFVVDGKSIAHNFVDQKQYLEVSEGEAKEFEIQITDPAGLRSINQRGPTSPFRIDWIQPNIARTPHKELVSGIKFYERWDEASGKYRFFMLVNGPFIQKKGLYIVNYFVQDRTPIKVEYFSSVQGLLTYNNNRYQEGVVTVAYGVDKCAQAAATAPDYLPFYNAATKFLKSVGKETSSKKFKGLSQSAIRFLRETGRARQVASRNLKQGLKSHNILKAMNLVSVSDADILPHTAKLDEVVANLVSKDKRGFKNGVVTLGRVSTLVRAHLSTQRGKAKISRSIKKLEKLAHPIGNTYLNELRGSMTRRSAFKDATNQCELDLNNGQ